MKYKIIHVLCVGQTEQGFVKEVLAPYLQQHGIQGVKSILITTNKKKNARGGVLSYSHAKTDIDLLLRAHKDEGSVRHIFTTMFDLYALPNDFPGYEKSKTISDPYSQVQQLEESFAEAINDRRFIPYIQLHEFEALLFCGIEYIMSLYPDSKSQCQQLYRTLSDIGNPELINNRPETAPSKRIIKAVEGDKKTRYSYNKPTTGKIVTGKIGVDVLRSKCKHFDEWIENLIGW